MRIFFLLQSIVMNLTSFRKSSKSAEPHYLLFGNPVAHSFSPLMHNAALDYYDMKGTYYAIGLDNRELTELAVHLNEDAFLGANITLPYKQVLMDYVDVLDRSADAIGAVNTITRSDYRLKGYNTDLYGFLAPLDEHEDVLAGERAIIFGTGGASRAIVAALDSIGMESIYLISRNPNKKMFEEYPNVFISSYDEWTALAEESALIVNATPLGMYPQKDESPVRENEKQFLAGRICYDIVYNPLQTNFMEMGESVGASVIGGLDMLIQQGSRSFELWTGKSFPDNYIRRAIHEKLKN